jgi:uncharacterized protein YhaN
VRIERVELDGFGRFHEHGWTFEPGLTVIHGANEAGKTTFLNAVRALLFGFEATRDGRTWYPAYAGGKRGGRLVLITDAGERWVVERHGERGGTGALAVRAPSGNVGGQETLDRLLRGADRDLFNNVFAFGLGELQDLRTLSAAAVKGRIYGAGAGLGGASAVDLERELRADLRDTFVPTGTKPPLNALLARAEALRGEIAELTRQPEEHVAAHRERAHLGERIAVLQAEARAARERAAHLERARRIGPIAAEAALIEAELAAGDAALDRLPEDAVAGLERREGAVDRAAAVTGSLDEQLAEVRQARALIDVDERLLAAADEILALRDERAARATTAASRRELEMSAARHAAESETLRAQVGGWEEARLLALDDSIAAVDATRSAERRITEARATRAAAEQRVRAAADELAAREREVVTEVAEADVERQMAALRALDALPSPAAASPALPPVLPWLVGAVAGLVTGIAVATLAAQPAIGALAGLLTGIMAALVMRARAGRTTGASGSSDPARWLAEAGLPPDADRAAVAARRDELAAQRARAELARESATALEARREDLRRREAEEAAALQQLEAAISDWRTWLAERELPTDLTPDGARQVLLVVSTARKAVAERDRARQRLVDLDRDDEAYGARVCVLLGRIGLEDPAEASRRDAAVAGAVDGLERARADSRRAAELEAATTALEEKHAGARATLDDARRSVEDYLASLGCPDADTLRARAASADERRRHQSRLRELRAELVGIAGGSDALDGLVAEARAADPDALDAEAGRAAEEADRLEAEEREAFARIGAIDARIRELEAASELGTKRQELAALEGQAAAMARSWTVRAIALRLLEETRARYERERQPDVIRAAERHFERITGGRYPRIVAPPGEDAVRVETEGGSARSTDELSRGTAEQLYLALRFGLIEEFARHAEPLPVVMDDILVNFDAERAGRAATVIRDLASRHQVLVFTCHRSTVELLDPEGARTLTLA